MKKIYLSVLIVLFLFSSCAVDSNKMSSSIMESLVQVSEVVSSNTINSGEDIEHKLNISIDHDDYTNGDKITDFDATFVDYDIRHMKENIVENIKDEKDSLIIKDVYTYKDILYAKNNIMLYLGGDYAAWAYKGSVVYWGDTCRLLSCFIPSNNRFYKDKYYCVYDIKDYGRLYFYFSDINDFEFPVGYPMLISKKMNLSDFESIKPGDPIYKVIDVDKVTEIYCAQFLMSTFTSESVYYLNESGKTLCSLHYLDEGILRIEYDILDNGEYIVADKILLENYQFTDYKGRLIDLSIMEKDLP